MWDAKCCEDYCSLSRHNGTDLIATSFINLMAPSQRYMSQHGVLQEILLPYSKKFEYRLLRIFVYDFFTARSVFAIQPQGLREIRNVKRKRIVLF
jgi:hypothetical protein